ncbi:hypothetical protein COLO4_02418 [Corchorus olitorius]|uniref:Uncharacterized protein n=1 Tax=Corchorus olitorius TaxID=93759 RepID=A0A1R3L120_9ROSI|nr:hypothetical protein COLO4_02418 [Corchorus olitorius]
MEQRCRTGRALARVIRIHAGRIRHRVLHRLRAGQHRGRHPDRCARRSHHAHRGARAAGRAHVLLRLCAHLVVGHRHPVCDGPGRGGGLFRRHEDHRGVVPQGPWPRHGAVHHRHVAGRGAYQCHGADDLAVVWLADRLPPAGRHHAGMCSGCLVLRHLSGDGGFNRCHLWHRGRHCQAGAGLALRPARPCAQADIDSVPGGLCRHADGLRAELHGHPVLPTGTVAGCRWIRLHARAHGTGERRMRAQFRRRWRGPDQRHLAIGQCRVTAGGGLLLRADAFVLGGAGGACRWASGGRGCAHVLAGPVAKVGSGGIGCSASRLIERVPSVQTDRRHPAGSRDEQIYSN